MNDDTRYQHVSPSIYFSEAERNAVVAHIGNTHTHQGLFCRHASNLCFSEDIWNMFLLRLRGLQDPNWPRQSVSRLKKKTAEDIGQCCKNASIKRQSHETKHFNHGRRKHKTHGSHTSSLQMLMCYCQRECLQTLRSWTELEPTQLLQCACSQEDCFSVLTYTTLCD